MEGTALVNHQVFSEQLTKFLPLEYTKGINFEWNCTQLKFKPGTVEKNESTLGPPAGIEHTLLRCRCNALCHRSTKVADRSKRGKFVCTEDR